MSWINSRQFTISNRNGRHYVFRRNNAGNTEINIPRTITTKGQAIAWLKAHPNKVAQPNRYRAKGARRATAPNKERLIPYKNNQGRLFYRRLLPGAPLPKYVPPPPIVPRKPYKKLPNMPAGSNTWKLTCSQLQSALVSKTPLGKGRQGIVYAAEAVVNSQKRSFAVKISPRDLDAARRGERQPFDIEYDIQDAVQILTPNVVRVYKSIRCENFITPDQMNMPNVQDTARFDKSKQGILLIELANGGSLSSWLKKQTKVTDATLKRIISDILGALFAIHKKYPYFRHNDLHMQNVFVAERGFLIGDFGWARLKKMGTNPAVNTANGTKTASFWGVGPKTDDRYDQHLFLNELLDWAQRHSPADHPRAIEFLKKAVPTGYRGATDTHVSEWRLKYGDPCTGLPSLAAVMHFPFLAGKKRVSSLNLMAAKAKLKTKKVERISSVNLILARAKLRKVAKEPPVKVKRFSSANLTKAKAKLRKVAVKASPSPVLTKRVVLPPAVLRTAKFNKLVEKFWINNGSQTNNFRNAWNRARVKAIEHLEKRLSKNLPVFTPSPPKAPKTKSPKAKAPSPPKAPKLNYKLSPSSGRAKIRAPNSGRYVYANGPSVSMEYLKNLAGRLQVNIKGLRSKANIARKIFSR